jgi:PAS domain S-box-containing protein
MNSSAEKTGEDAEGLPELRYEGMKRNIESAEAAHAKAALLQSEEHFRALFENAPIGITITVEGINRYANLAGLKMLGYSNLSEVAGTSQLNRVAPEFREFAAGRIREHQRNPSLQGSYEILGLKKDGTTIPLSARVVGIALDGRPGTLTFLEDLTERRTAENALRESERRMSDIIDFLPDPTFVIDKDGRVIAWNGAMEEITGIPAMEMIGKGGYEYALPFYGERRPILIDLALNPDPAIDKKYVTVKKKDEIVVGEAYMPALRGGEVYLLGTASVLRDSNGAVIGAIESIHDLTARRKAEVALGNALEFNRAIINGAEDGIAVLDRNLKFLAWNRVMAAGTGISDGDVLGKNALELFPALTRSGMDRLLTRALHGETSLSVDMPFSTSIGAERWVQGHFGPYRDGEGNVAGVIGVFRDVTERVEAEKARREKEQLRLQLVQAQKMEALGTLAGGIAHDFNNVLMAIIGFAELAGVEEDDDGRQECLSQVLTACERAKGLINQILTFSRMREMERRPVQMNQLVKEALKLLRSSIPTTIEIRPEIDSRPLIVHADPTHIHQVLMNLCANAAHAMREKGGTLAVILTSERFGNGSTPTPCGLPDGRYVKLQVADTGHGMSEETKTRIFEPFFTTKPQGEGTGLGLSVVYGIVKSWEGAIDIGSKPGKGTTVTIILPAVVCADTASRTSDAELSAGSEHILFVDDEPVLADLGARLLRSLGYRVTSRTSSLEALDYFRIRHSEVDLVITDITMPHLTGADLARKMIEIQRDIPIVLCTGYSEMINEEKARNIGAHGYIMKPVNRADLAKAVRGALDGGKDRT